MKFEIRERDRRAVLMLLTAVGLYVILSFGVLPAFDALREAAGGTTNKEQQLSKYRRALVRKGNYTQLLEQARKNMAADQALFIRGDNPSLAAVELQTIVEGAATKTGLTLNQRNISAARKKDDFFNEITMTVALDATPLQISSFLTELRNAPKFVVVRTVQLAPTEVLHEAPPKGGFKKVLRANLTISGLLPAPARKNG
jgi:Type II secretion system (T2SS), protein M subtype b